MQDEANPNPDELLPEDHEPDEAEIDRFLDEQDPEFAARMKDLAADKNLKLAEVPEEDVAEELRHEIAKWEHGKPVWKFIYRNLTFLPGWVLGLRKLRAKLAAKAVALAIASRNRAHDLALGLWKGTRKGVVQTASSLKEGVGGGLKSFGAMSLKRKLLLVSTLAVIAGAGYGVYFAFTGRLLPGQKELFIANFADEGAPVFEYDPAEKPELFFDNVRSTPNLLLITKMVVNIRPSSNSGENPMLAVEFFAEGMSPESILELKSREAFFRDRMQRKIEEYSFDVLDTPPGKQGMAADLLKDLNRNLSQGQLRGLRIKTIVLKP